MNLSFSKVTVRRLCFSRQRRQRRSATGKERNNTIERVLFSCIKNIVSPVPFAALTLYRFAARSRSSIPPAASQNLVTRENILPWVLLLVSLDGVWLGALTATDVAGASLRASPR